VNVVHAEKLFGMVTRYARFGGKLPPEPSGVLGNWLDGLAGTVERHRQHLVFAVLWHTWGRARRYRACVGAVRRLSAMARTCQDEWLRGVLRELARYTAARARTCAPKRDRRRGCRP